MALALALGARAGAAELPTGIEETVVTAQRVEENVQDVPLSVAVLTGDELEIRSVQRIADLITRLPNVQITGDANFGANGGAFTIRGIPDVLTYVDGVYGFWPFGSIARQVIEVERIEVLRGPQGTLFGKDATGGAIQYITKPPGDRFDVRGNVVLGDYSRRDVTAIVDWPLSDTLKTKWTGAHLARDGFVESALIDRSFGDFEDEVLRGDLLWTPTDAVRLRFNVERNEYRANGQPRVVVQVLEPQPPFSRISLYGLAGVPFTNAHYASGYPGGDLDPLESRSTYRNDGWVLDEHRAVLDLDWRFADKISLKAIAGNFDVENDSSIDHCSCELNVLFLRTLARTEIASQEVQLRGQHGPVRWIAGIYHADGHGFGHDWGWQFQDFRTDPALLAQIAPIVPPGNFEGGSAGHARTLAAFGQARIELAPKSFLTFGIRRSHEEVDFTVASFARSIDDEHVGGDPLGPIDVYSGTWRHFSFDHDAPRASFERHWTDRLMTYASYAEGFNSGGLNVPGVPQLPETIPFDPATVKTSELGLRSDWLDGRLRVNATAFSTQWVDIQVPVFFPDPTTGTFIPITIVVNAAAARAHGAEIELTVRPSERWRVDASVGLLDARYTDVGGALDIAPSTPFANAPEHSYSLGVERNAGLTNGGRFAVRVDYGWVDDYLTETEATLQVRQKAYGLASAEVSYLFPGGRHRLSLFGTNLTDERYFDSAVTDPAAGYTTATLGRPRELGVRFASSLD